MSERRRPLWQVGLILGLAAILMACFAALGIWQVERRAWKHDLIARVEARIHADPLPIDLLDGLSPAEVEYDRVSVTGRFDNARETLVKAVTELGGGYWVLTPLTADDGLTVLINRGFVPEEMRDLGNRSSAESLDPVTIIGLARRSEPGGGFLRSNDPQGNRWYSRDVEAIARARGLGPVASFFIDAEAAPTPGSFPVGGLTVVQFRDAHLSYALTWFALAAMVAVGIGLLIRSEIRLRRSGGPAVTEQP